MIIIGILAAIAIPAFLGQRQQAYEASAKLDVKSVVKEALAYYVDASGPLTVTQQRRVAADQRPGAAAGGRLSKGNSISARSYVNSVDDYCVSILNSQTNPGTGPATGPV